MYDYDDYWEEPSEFEIQIEEFKDSLRNAVRDEIKAKIQSLEKELEELKEFRLERDNLVRKYEAEIQKVKREAENTMRAAKESEKKWKKARLHQLLGEYLTVGWIVDSSWEMGKKCDKCDTDRKIHFTSPQGKKYSEDCNCAKRYYTYFPKEATLSKFYVRKKNFNWNDNEVDFRNRYYVVEDDGDYDRYSSVIVVDNPEFDYKKINPYGAVFLNEEDCQRYCDWRQEKERGKND